MRMFRTIWGALVVACTATTMASIPASAQPQQQQQPQGQKPNILFIMGDDIGWMQPSIYHRGLMVGETPNIEKVRTVSLLRPWVSPSSAKLLLTTPGWAA